MAASFLGKWFGKSPAPSADLAGAVRELDAALAERPAFREPLSALKAVLPALAEPAGFLSGFGGDLDVSQARLAGGVPVLRGEALVTDSAVFQRRWHRVAAAVGGPPRPPLGPAELVAAVLAGTPGPIHAAAESAGLDAGLTATVLRLTLFADLVPLATKLEGLRIGLRSGWERGYCPTCGSWPLLGEFRGLDQGRYLRCGLCATGWEVPRLFCPFCGCRDHERLQFLFCEGEEAKYRAATCDACRGYVKMVSALSALPPLHLLAADALTLHLDLAAGDRGYVVPG